MKNKYFFFFISAFLFSISFNSSAKENIGNYKTKLAPPSFKVLAGSCVPTTAQTDLDINNVRTSILAGGDMWWDLITPRYEIPKASKKHSLFAGALWIGGIDAGGQLKVAAMTYRQGANNDFWTGPLDKTSASVSLETCNAYDKHFKITRKEVDDYFAWTQSPSSYSGYIIPTSILNWPAHGDPSKNQDHFLAPFHDGNGDGNYTPTDPAAGDYPDYNVLSSGGCTSQLFGDQTLWWVFNDKGNIHTETNAESIGLEIHAQAFAFATNDEINNMTFYNYKIINRSSFSMNKTYFGQWVDADLGKFNDDFVGCDVQRGLGYCYNGTDNDGIGAIGEYGANPPAIGIDFFQGPLADAGDGIDNNRNGVIDEPGEQIIMSKFIYYNNDLSVRGNPENASHYYNYLSGFWKDGLPFTYGGDAYNETGPICDFMFPGDSDPLGWGTNKVPQLSWDERTVNNTPADRRFIQSAGPFTLLPGAVNTITTGVVWARTTQGGALASVNLMKAADDKAQALFDNCFKVLNGPDAPDLTIQELKNELLIYISNKPTSNNYLERYTEYDPLIAKGDSLYHFEGYQIFQVKDSTVSSTDIHNPDKARLVVQCDIKNGISQIVNFTFDPALNANVPLEEVNGADKGITHSFKITDDQFATGVKTLVNHKSYYFMAITYAYNNYKTYNQNDPTALDGQKKIYKAGRKNIKVYTGIPHHPAPEKAGTDQNSIYGTGPQLTRIEGQGNGGNLLELTDATVTQILTDPSNRVTRPTYKNGKGPISIKVIDPLNVPAGNFEIKLNQVTGSAKWTLKNISTGQTINSDTTIAIENEQLIPEWGLSVTISQILILAGDTLADPDFHNGFQEASMTFTDDTKRWLQGLPDRDGPSPFNWIRSGKYADDVGAFDDVGHSKPAGVLSKLKGPDENQDYEKLIGGTWAPFALCAYTDPKMIFTGGPAINVLSGPKYSRMMSNLASVDIVLTSDQSKWTRCVVLELQEETILAEGEAAKLDIRKGASIDKNGTFNYPAVDNNDFATGMGWFPGYAINIETGERLNMAYGEDSWLAAENGRDMQWNPTSNTMSNLGQLLYGGKHYIYVFGHNGNRGNDVPRYDGGAFIRQKLANPPAANATASAKRTYSDIKKDVFNDAMWVNIPLLAFGHTLLETDVKIRIRESKPYAKAYAASWGNVFNASSIDTPAVAVNNNYPLYAFSTSDITTRTNSNATAKTALDMINVVPNPYYAYSAYEGTTLDNIIKITNLPEKCTISIYTINGTLIRVLSKSEPTTSFNWDLKNQAGIPIASGLYLSLIHI